jgi:hypothetical protein
MARTKLNDGQLEKLVNADKVSGAALNITGSDVSSLTSLTGGDHFLVQSGSAVPTKITADAMQDFFSKTDIRETGASASYQLVFVDDDNEYNAANASSYSSFQTSRLQESTVSSSTTSMTFSPEYGASAAAGLAVIFTDSSSNKIAFTFDSSVSSGATSVAVTYNAGLSNATSMSKSSISSVTSVSKGSGDGNLRVDGSDLTYNPSTNLLTVGGDISVGDDILMASNSAVLSMGASADVTFTHDGSAGLAIAAGGAFDIDAAGALTLDGSSITIGGDSDVAVDFDSSTFDLDASGAITIDGTSTLSIDAADDSNLTVTASGKDLDIAVAGGSTQELRLASAGTGASALHLNASAGSVDIDSADNVTIDAADEITLTTTSADGHISLVSAHTSGVAFHIDANANAASEVQIDAGILDVDVTGAATMDAGGSITLTGAGVLLAGGSSEVDITTSGAFDVNVGSVDLDSSAGVAIDGTVLSLDGTDDSNLTVTASGKDLDIAVAGGSTQELRLASAGTGASALHLNASAGSVDIDSADNVTIDAADEITLTTTSADGHISLVSAHTSGVAFHIDANADAASEVQIDAGVLDMDVTGAATLDAGGAIGITGAGVDVNAGSGTLELTSSGAVDVNSGAFTLDASTVSIDGSGALNIDTTDTSNGIDIGTATSGVPITIGHSTSEVTVADNLTVTGNLTINGDTTTISTTNLNVEDCLIVLQAENTSSSSSSDLGIIMERGSTGDNAAMIWDEGADKFLFGTTTETGADTDVTVTVGTVQVGKLEIDGTSDYLDVDTNLKVIAAADIVLDPGGNNVVPGSNAADSLGRAATSASHSAGSPNSGMHTNLATGSSLNFDMDASQNQVIFYGSGFSPGSGSSVSGISGSNLSAISSLSGFASTPSGTLTITGSPSVSLSAGTIISIDGSSSSAFFVVVEDYSGGSSLKVTFIPTAFYSSNTTSVSSISGMKQYGGASVSSGYAGSSVSADTTMKFNQSGSSNTAVFMAKSAISSSSPILVVVDPRDDLSSGISSFPGSTTYGGSSQTSGGSITEAASRVAWDVLYVDDIDLGGQGSLSVGGTGRIDLDADDDTSIRASADDIITFEAGGTDRMSMSAAALYPASDDGIALGGASNNWSDLYMADGAVMNFGDDQDVSLTHVADTGLLLSSTDQLQFGDSGTFINQGADGQLDLTSDGQIDLNVGAAGVIVKGTTPKLTIGDAAAEDTFLVFDGNAEDFRIGIDDGTDILEIGSGASHGAQIAIKIDGSENVDIASHDASSVGLKLAGTLVTSTAAELNVMDGGTSATSTTVATGDRVVFNDAGTMKQVSVDQIGQYYGGGNGIQASSAGVLSIECVTDIATSVTKGSILSSDLKTGSLSQNMVSGSLQVFLNGMLQTQSGSVEGTPDGGSQGAVYDYHLLTDTGPPKIRFEEALDGDDVLQLRYIKA